MSSSLSSSASSSITDLSDDGDVEIVDDVDSAHSVRSLHPRLAAVGSDVDSRHRPLPASLASCLSNKSCLPARQGNVRFERRPLEDEKEIDEEMEMGTEEEEIAEENVDDANDDDDDGELSVHLQDPVLDSQSKAHSPSPHFSQSPSHSRNPSHLHPRASSIDLC